MAALVPLLAPWTFRTSTTANHVQVERQAYLMGTACRLVTYAANREAGLARLERMLRALEMTEQRLSTWRDDTALARLNRQPVGRPVQLDPDLCGLLRRLGHWWQQTEGAFDPAVGSLVEAWGLRSGGRTPEAAPLARARARSGFEHIALDQRCRLTRSRQVTLEEGAFGKGAGLDRAAAAAAKGGSWLIDLGGQVIAGGPPAEARGWDVALAHPLQRDRPALMVTLVSGSLSTSGGSERDVTVDGHRIGHLLDPRTGRPAAFTGSVTVWHSQALAADILSTALYVMGPEAGRHWAEAHRVAVCFLVPRRGGRLQVLKSQAFEERFDRTTDSRAVASIGGHR
ncbi:MAG: FAD:protein FMN transferase [Vicinamibacteraceae bacterium]